jgi:hypothetical protein
MKTPKGFIFASKLTCIVALAALIALASPMSLAQINPSQVVVQKPLVLVFTATFAPKVGEGPTVQYEFQADSFLLGTRLAMAWGKEYCPQNVLVSLVPRAVATQEIYTATFEPKVGKGPSLQYEFHMDNGSSNGTQADSFLRAIRMCLDWGHEYWPQHVLVSFVPKSQGPQEAVSPVVGVNMAGPIGAQVVFTARMVSRESGLVMQQEFKAQSFLGATRATLNWSKVHCPEHVLFSLVLNQ